MWGEFTGGKRIFNPPSPVLKALPQVHCLVCVICLRFFMCCRCTCIYIYIFFILFFYIMIRVNIFLYLCYICIFSIIVPTTYHLHATTTSIYSHMWNKPCDSPCVSPVEPLEVLPISSFPCSFFLMRM